MYFYLGFPTGISFEGFYRGHLSGIRDYIVISLLKNVHKNRAENLEKTKLLKLQSKVNENLLKKFSSTHCKQKCNSDVMKWTFGNPLCQPLFVGFRSARTKISSQVVQHS